MQAANAGLIINSMGWVTELGFDLLVHSMRAFKVNTVLVLGDDRLYANLHQHCQYGPFLSPWHATLQAHMCSTMHVQGRDWIWYCTWAVQPREPVTARSVACLKLLRSGQ